MTTPMQDDNTPDLPQDDDLDLEAFIAMLREQNDDDEQTDDEPPDDAPPAAADDTPPPPPPDESIWEYDDGTKLNREQAYNLAQFDAWLEANPELAAQIAGVASGQMQVVPTQGRGVPTDAQSTIVPTTPANTPPEELDLDDPATRRLWQELQSTKQQLESASEVLTRHEQRLEQQNAQTYAGIVERATASYAEKHTLTGDQMKEIRQQAALMLPNFTSPTDPRTGLPRNVDTLYAIEQALDAARWSLPAYRQQLVQELAQQQIKDMQKKSKLTSLGGSSGSVPRKTQTPQTESERRAAMIREVAGAMNGDGNG